MNVANLRRNLGYPVCSFNAAAGAAGIFSLIMHLVMLNAVVLICWLIVVAKQVRTESEELRDIEELPGPIDPFMREIPVFVPTHVEAPAEVRVEPIRRVGVIEA
jgi:hypothetical protein